MKYTDEQIEDAEMAKKDAEIAALKAQILIMNTRIRYDAVAFERDEKGRVALTAQVKTAKAESMTALSENLICPSCGVRAIKCACGFVREWIESIAAVEAA